MNGQIKLEIKMNDIVSKKMFIIGNVWHIIVFLICVFLGWEFVIGYIALQIVLFLIVFLLLI